MRDLFVWLLVALGVAASAWWVLGTAPTAEVIAAARADLPQVPELNLPLLSQPEFTDRLIHGALPITPDPATLGRDDPFAGPTP